METAELQNCKLFLGLTAEEMQLILPLFYTDTFKANQTIIHEGEFATHLYIIKSGKADLTHRHEDNSENNDFPYEVIGPGKIIGEQSLLPGTASPVTIKTAETTEVYGVNSDKLINLIKKNPSLHKKILANIGITLSEHLQMHATATVSALKQRLYELNTRIKMGVFVVYALAIIFLYNIIIEYVDDYINPFTPRTYVTVVFLIFTAIAMLVMIKQMGDPISEFGLNIRNWRQQLWESTWWSLLFMLALTALKWILIHFIPEYSHVPLFDLSAITHIPHYSFATHSAAQWYIPALLYILFVPIQAFIVQGAFQSALMRFLVGKHTVIIAVLLADLLFAAIHVDLNFTYALAVVIPGLLWGVLYIRERSIVGVSWSHMLIGFWSLWLLGFDRLIGLAPPL